tara:strand:- start:1326 stop:1652 length:327 start_codon:yes stop_codon:yes gene_type:complete
MPGLNPRDLQKAMKRMGIKQEEITADEVIIKCEDRDIIIKNPSVMKVNAMGQENFQISGEITEQENLTFTEEDIKTVAEQANVSEEKAKEALENNEGDLAKTIMQLKE